MRTDAGKDIIQLSAFVIAAGMAVCFSVGFAAQARAGRGRAIKLDDRINPNDAPAASMMRLPGISAVRAQAIVAYRENFAVNSGGKPAFKDCGGLRKVKGLGPKTVKNISPWLEFE
jgi:DNA uptake protein ComE-like DNA-binding protein